MTDYKLMNEQLAALIDGETEIIPILANASALLWQSLSEINWAGFYIMKNEELLLGPFQGKVACVHIPIGKGVCGTAVQKDEVLRVDDVHTFKSHIACDSASNSEIVVPIHKKDGSVFGVIDIDSPVKSRFSKDDETGISAFARILEQKL